jgi:O-6-methylguanine DNA methyltransferase
MRLIADGVVDRDGVTGLASRLGYSVRQIQRELTAEIGAGPLQQIPYGQTESYGELAERIGSPGGARAVGMANGKNPIGVVIPCHRVVGSDGGLTGHGGGLDRKRGLLDLEPAVSGSAFLWKGHPLCRPITSAPTEPVAAGGHRDLDHPVAVGHWSPQ